MRSAILVACLLVPGVAVAGERNAYMPTQGPSCIDHSRRYEGAWSCRGPAGYTADFSDEGNRAAFAIRPPARMERAVAYAFQGLGPVFGKVVDWRIVDGRPVAAVLRIWRAQPRADGSEVEIEELTIFKVSPQETCRVASVDARQSGANEAARRLASEILDNTPCADTR